MASTFASRSYRDLAVVLRTHKLGEADRIITCLTAYHGVVRAVAKGVRRTSSKFGARLEPFMVADVQFVHGRSLDIATQVESRSSYGAMIAADFEKYTAASIMTETAEQLTDTAAADRSQFDLIYGALSALARGVHSPDLVLGSYLLRSLSMAGWAVTWSQCSLCSKPGAFDIFHAASGGPVCPACRPPGSRQLRQGMTTLLAALQQAQWEKTTQLRADVTHEAVSVAIDYAQHHLERRLTSVKAMA